MYNRLYDNNVETNFIKNLLTSTEIPIIKYWESGYYVSKNSLYLYNDAIYKSKITGVANSISQLTKLDAFIPYKHVSGVTSKLKSNSLGYDVVTHEYLGNYLRFLKHEYNADLMSMYNCFAAEYIDNLFINVTDYTNNQVGKESFINHSVNYIERANLRYKVLSVPIKLNNTYTIFVESELPIVIIPCLYGAKGIIKRYSKANEFLKRYIKIVNSSVFSDGIIFDSLSANKLASDDIINSGLEDIFDDIASLERELKLIIQIPTQNNSSVVVLEGKYEKPIVKTTIQDKVADKDTFITSISYPNNKLGLAQINDGYNYAFSDKLLGYLLNNTITAIDSIPENIQRIQEYASSTTCLHENGVMYTDPYTKGIWSDSLKDFLKTNTLASSNIAHKVDITGYVDKDVEKFILRGQEK